MGVNEPIGTAADLVDTLAIRFWLRTYIGSLWRSIAAATLLSAVAAGVSFYVISQVGAAIGSPDRTVQPLVALVGLPTLVIVSVIARTTLSRVAQDVTQRIRYEVLRRILEASLRRVEEATPARLIAAATNDVQKVSAAFGSIPVVIFNALLLVGGGAYIAAASPRMLGWIVIYTVVTAATSFGVQRKAIATLRHERTVYDRVMTVIREVVHGKKELALSGLRRRRLLDRDLPDVLTSARLLGVRADQSWELLAAWNNAALLGLLVALTLFQPETAADRVALAQTALIVFFLQAPLGVMIDMAQRWGHARVSFANLRALQLPQAMADDAAPDTGARSVDRIVYRGIRFAYGGTGDERSFGIGPLDIGLRTGQVTIITGGNGSGKTSLCRVLCGLYTPDTGAIEDGSGSPLTPTDLRRLSIALFSDYFPFETVVREPAETDEARAAEIARLLAAFRLSDKTALDGLRWRTIDLSSGQARRLALVSILLEDKALYLFDEPTSDQDAEMRRLFYAEVVDELKRRGKIVVIVSHDERSFEIADQLLLMEDGQLVPHSPAPAMPLSVSTPA